MKKVAVLSDIHGNHIALKRCVSYALEQGADTFLFLGDYTGEVAYPEKTMEMLYQLSAAYQCYFVRGNKEDYWLDYQSRGEQGWKEYDSTTGSLYYTYRRLTPADLDFFRSMDISQSISLGAAPKLTICHGSPYKVNEKLLPGTDRTKEIMDNTDTSAILCGHTHVQGSFYHNGKWVWNAGSVGVPLGSGGKAQFLLLQEKENQWEPEFISLEYNTQAVIAELHESGLNRYAPCWCKVTENLLRKGTPSHGTVLSEAMALCRAAEGFCNWPEVPEKYWEQAVKNCLG